MAMSRRAREFAPKNLCRGLGVFRGGAAAEFPTQPQK